MRRAIPATILCALSLVAGRAGAQPQGAALEQLLPPPAGDPFFGVPSPWASGHLVPRGVALFDYARDPLALRHEDGSPAGSLVSGQAYVHLGVSLAIWDRLMVSVAAPIAVAQSGDGEVSLGTATASSPSGAEMGDLRLGVRARVLGADAVALGVGADVAIPTGADDGWVNEGSVAVSPRLVLGGRSAPLVWSASAGTTLRTSENPHTLTYGAGVALRLADDRLQIGPELFGATALGGDDALLGGALRRGSGTNLEGILGAKLRLARVLVLGAGGGAGFTHAPGTPTWRVLGSVAYSPPHVDETTTGSLQGADRDGDGVSDDVDACPDVKGPSSPDAAIRGCPAADRDRDGVSDAADACPDVAGVASSDPEKSGCKRDTDDDGLPDDTDACPRLKGTASADPKANGCPADSDADGVLDAADACPEEKGVVSESAAEHGCPDDRDGDGIEDRADACPKERGARDPEPAQNGCPKAVRVTETEIVILRQVQFRFGLSGITQTVDPVSDDLLGEVRDVLAEHPEITKIEVQGHTDDVGPERFNVQLSASRAEAVRDWLIAHGVAADKLVARGHGPSRPVADNTTEAGRQKNRRVEFKILEKSR